MTTGLSGQQPIRRDNFIIGLQFSAALMIAHLIAGKAARDGLFLLQYGPRALPGMIAGAGLFSVVLSLLIGWLMRSVSPRAIVPWALLLSGGLQLMERWLMGAKPALASILIYLHMAGIGAVLLSTFWSMLNEEFDPREAKKKFSQIAAAGTVGGLCGGLGAERAVALWGAPALMVVLATLHLLAGAFLLVLVRRCATAPTASEDVEQKVAAAAPHKSSLLRTLAMVVLLGSIGAALLDYVFKVDATETWGRGANLLRFFAFFHTGVALLGVIIQSAVAKTALEKLGLGKTILTLPATLAGGSFLALVSPGLAMAAVARAAEAATRNSLFRAGYEICYTPVPAADKRLAKTFIDVGSERGGDVLGAGIVYLCLHLTSHGALPVILSIAALLGLCSVILCSTLDRIYLAALAKSLESRVLQLNFDRDMDLTTKSLVFRSPLTRGLGTLGMRSPASGESSALLNQQDVVLQQLNALRSSDVGEVHAALTNSVVTDRLVATQVCLLLAREEHALLAHGALFQSADKMLGMMTDLMLDPSIDVRARRRLPRIIGAVPGQRAVDSLVTGLGDPRFEMRMQCARSLVKAMAKQPRLVIPTERILTAVDRELAIGTVLWESQRKQQSEPGEMGDQWLDELLRGKAHGSLEYVFTLLSLLHDRAPLMAAFRSLHLEDRYLRGTAIEYLEGILPAKSRDLLWDILQERPSRSAGRQSGEILHELLNSSETVVLHLRRKGDVDPG